MAQDDDFKTLNFKHPSTIDMLREGKVARQKLQTPAVFENKKDATRVEQAKSNIEDALKIGKDALLELAEIAKESEHPKAYDSLNSMIRTIVDGNKALIDAENGVIGTGKNAYQPQQPSSTNVTIMAGTPAEILKTINGTSKKIDPE